MSGSEVNYVSVPFKGAYFMCVEGSRRASLLRKANKAWTMGYDLTAFELEAQARDAEGCAFENRENAGGDTNG